MSQSRELYSYFRSSAAYRVRIALAFKGLTYKMMPVNLVHAEHLVPAYLRLNPQGLLPLLRDQGNVLTQSLAIIEYLDEVYLEPPLYPNSAAARARVRAIAQMIACDIHPLNNLRVLQYLTNQCDLSDLKRRQWYEHWIRQGFWALEKELANSPETGIYCHGDQITVADVCLIPQVYNALRFNISLDQYPCIQRIHAHCQNIPCFIEAHPDAQPDARSK